LPIGPSADKLRVAREPGRLSGGPGVSSETRQYIEALLALSPWIAFVLAVAWFWVLDVRDNVRALRVYERERLRQPEKRAGRRPTTTT
jgi:hypothetical protein